MQVSVLVLNVDDAIILKTKYMGLILSFFVVLYNIKTSIASCLIVLNKTVSFFNAPREIGLHLGNLNLANSLIGMF